MKRALVYGLAIAGQATARALARRDVEVVAADDRVTDERRAFAEELGIELLDAPDDVALAAAIRACDVVVPSPGVPERHPVVTGAIDLGVELCSELELAYRWERSRPGGPRPLLGITGTDGKTTTTLLTVEMLRAAGLRTVDAGNTTTPLVDAIDLDLDAFVVECTSFRLAWTHSFRCEAGAWLNLAPDHLDWHESMDTYIAAKARLWAAQRPEDVAIGRHGDPVVQRELARAPGRRLTFSIDNAAADYHLDLSPDGEWWLAGPDGPIVPRAELRRNRPHDVANTLAACALVLESGLVDIEAIATAVARFDGPPHRLEPLGTWGGVSWYNDSKATTPHAAAAAIASFDRIVLIAGGYDKGVDLSPMAADASAVEAVVATGDTADRIVELFSPGRTVVRAGSLDEAVDRAVRLAGPGTTVLLSPGCASFDAYDGFEARGDHFRRLVEERTRQPQANDEEAVK